MKIILFLFSLIFLFSGCSNPKGGSTEEVDIEEERYFVLKKESPINLIELSNIDIA